MVGLIDIVPATLSVSVGGKDVSVNGVSAAGLAHLLGRFPELRALMSGQEVGTEQLIAMGGDVVGAIIAAGCGYPANEKAEQIGRTLPVGDQADILAAILKLTMPQGVGPFVEKLTALGTVLNAEAAAGPKVIRVRPLRSQAA